MSRGVIVSSPLRPGKHELYPYVGAVYCLCGSLSGCYHSYRRGLWRCLFDLDGQLQEPQTVERTTRMFHAFFMFFESKDTIYFA